MRINRLMVAVALIGPGTAGAQMLPSARWPVAASARVRITSPMLGGERQTGTVVSATTDTLFFRPANLSSSVAVATPDIVKMEIATGTHTRKAKGAGVGFLIGVGVGALVGAATWKKPAPCDFFCLPDSRSFDAFLGGSLGGLVGAVAGALIGAPATDTWVPVAIPRSSTP